ncbi:hypothetical protein KBZ19_00490 [Synechococcus sp. L2F]|uniref:hypothetical protein n=1 Tax=Synechococcus sp. L2F TaxID=2823739 RepID=UPI0020CF0C11|nr:hypothetical protein [Synechococcus sp. L2F]MCP9826969.1 hypothetical protein [Synechococcus sp. L2F]
MRPLEVSREERLAYLDLFRESRDLAIDSPFHYLLFDEALSPVVQALTLDEILSLHPTDAPFPQRVWICEDVVNLVVRKRNLWQPTHPLPQPYRRTGTMMLVVPPLDEGNQRGPGSWDTVYRTGKE